MNEGKRRSRIVLVPTAGELEILRSFGGWADGRERVEIAGFGPVAAAASAGMLGLGADDRVILVGIAGTHDDGALPPGAAASFARVSLDGIGVGEGEAAQGIAETGFAQVAAEEAPGGSPIGDSLELSSSGGHHLLTVCASSSDENHAALRRQRWPGIVAEDMEAFGVALVCARTGTPLSVVRGISNRAGDRRREGWKIEEGLGEAWERVGEVLSADGDIAPPRAG